MPLWMKIILGLYVAFSAVALGIVFAARLGLIADEGTQLLGGIMAFAAALPWAVWLVPIAQSENGGYVAIVGGILLNGGILSAVGWLIGRRRAPRHGH